MENQKPKDQESKKPKKTKKKLQDATVYWKVVKDVKKNYLLLICVFYVNVKSHFVQNIELQNHIIVK